MPSHRLDRHLNPIKKKFGPDVDSMPWLSYSANPGICLAEVLDQDFLQMLA